MSAHVPTIEQMASALGQAFPDTVFETIQLDEDADGNGGLTIGWNSDEFHVIPAGTKVGEYILMEPYFPQDNGGGKFRYEPKFSDPVALLEKTPFIFKTMDAEGGNLDLFTFPFTGLAGTIIGKLQDAIRLALGDNSWLCVTGQGITASITVDFDGDTLKSAAQKIAQACGCTLHYTWKQLNFGTRAVYGGNEFYNRFIVFGGTTNMSRKIVSGQYTSVVKRLTLDETLYPDSIIDKSAGGTPMTKLLVFDDIYPKMELFIAAVHERRCYLIDENGEKIPDGGYETDGSGSYILDEDGERIPTYKQYSKWYVRLRYADGTQFTLNNDIILVGQTLKLLFQPNYDIFSGETPQADETSPLAAREFEVAYFDTATHEYEADDVDINGWNVPEGWFRIIFTAEGETIIPTTSELQLTPRIGNKVTLINVALSGQYTDIARQQLLAAANAAIGDYDNVGLGGKAVAYPSDGEWPAQVSGVKAPLPDVGGLYQGLFVSSKSTDLITGREEITYGTFGERSLINSMIDKIDNAQTNGGGGTTKGNNFESGQNTQNSQNWRTLQLAGGNLGVKTVVQHVTNITDSLVRDVEAVQEQVDQKVDMWFRVGVPYPNEYSPNHAANAPVSEWPAEDYEAHADDLYYDRSQIPDSYQSSLVWRWEYDETLGKWLWKNVTDAHTIDALEKIVDVASDGIISTGTEKSRLLIEWNEAVAKYNELSSSASNLGTKYTAYVTAFQAVGTMLNGGSTLSDVSVIPLWLNASNFDTNTKLSDYNVSPSTYRTTWNTYYAALEDLTGEIKAKKCSIFVSNNPPSPPYNVGDMWIIPNEDNKVMVCINGRSLGSGIAADWQEMSAVEDVRTMLALMVEQCYLFNKESLAGYTEEFGQWVLFNIYLLIRNGSRPSSAYYGSISFDPNNANENKKIAIYDYDSGDWKDISTSEEGYDSLYSALETVYKHYVGESSVTFYVYSGKSVLPESLPEHCLIARELTYTDPLLGSGNSIKGGIDILWCNESAWELISKATSAAIENLGNAVRMVVFGNENFGDGHVSLQGGTVFTKAMGMMFSNVLDAYGNPITGAYITTSVLKNGERYISNAKIEADKVEIASGTSLFSLFDNNARLIAGNINFQSGTFTIDASHIAVGNGAASLVVTDNGTVSLNGALIKLGSGLAYDSTSNRLSFNGDSVVINARNVILTTSSGDESNLDSLFYLTGDYAYLKAGKIRFQGETIDMTGATISLNADQIDFKGRVVISDNGVSKFSVDANGNVTMNNATMNNATMNNAVVNGTFANGTFDETTHRSTFGVFLKGVLPITSQRNDYLGGTTTRGGLVSIFGRNDVNDPSNTYRGIYCEGEAEIQGVTQLLRSNANKNNSSVNALIVEGVDNKGNETVAGSLNANGPLNVNGALNLAGCLKTSSFTLPQSPSNGQTYIFKAKSGETVKVSNPYHAIINGSNTSNAVAAGSEFNTGGYTVMLIFSSYHNAWLIMQSN